jgi:hypothetical protein
MSAEEKDLLKSCTRQIEEMLQWGDSAAWSNSDLEDLSTRIFEKTQVKLSISTLKRIWGKVKYENTFNKATLNALAQFLGYDNWRTFSNQNSVPTYGLPVSSDTGGRSKGWRITPVKTLVVSVAGILFLAIFLLSFKKESATPKNLDASLASFKAKKTTDNLPNSVIFNYDVSAFGIDTAIIQQNWDPRRRENVSARKNVHTSIYYYPGNFNARLIVDNKIVKTDRVFIQTKGWKGIIADDPIPVYLSDAQIIKKGSLGVDSEVLREKINSSVFNEQWVSFYNVRNFAGIKSSNFSFEAEVKNTSKIEESICRKVQIHILFNGGAIIIPLSDKGCVSSLELLTGSEMISGKTRDLSEFGCDFSKPQKIKCDVHNKQLSIILNDRKIFSSKVNIEEELVGLCFSFEGTGEIAKVKLGEPGKFPLYFETF